VIRPRYTSASKTPLVGLLAEGTHGRRSWRCCIASCPQADGEEQATCQRFIRKVGDRKEALEDVLWTLVNSTEFLIKK
jgi:hypothetical protein